MTKKIRRKRIVVNGRFQFGYLLSLLFAVLLTAAVTSFIVAGYAVCSSRFTFVGDFNRNVALLLLAGVAVVLGVLLVRSLFFTHAVAGPVHKACAVLREAAGGTGVPGTLRFRRNDHFSELAEEINNCLTIMEKYATLNKEAVRKLNGIIHETGNNGTLDGHTKMQLMAVISELDGGR